MKKAQGKVHKLVLARETLRTLDVELSQVAGGTTISCYTCTSLTSANSACHAQDTTPLCE